MLHVIHHIISQPSATYWELAFPSWLPFRGMLLTVCDGAYSLVGRIRARYLTARFPNPPVRTVREAFTSYGSRKRDITGRVHFANSTELFPVDSLTRSLATFVQFPYPLPQGLRHQSSSWCARLSRAQTTMPYLTSQEGIGLSYGSHLPTSTALTILPGISRVQQIELIQGILGGVFCCPNRSLRLPNLNIG
jgi:hypothetical protein